MKNDAFQYQSVNGKWAPAPRLPELDAPSLPVGKYTVVNSRRIPNRPSNAPSQVRSPAMRPADSTMRTNGRWVRYNPPSASPPVLHPPAPAPQARVGAAAGEALSYDQVKKFVRLHNNSGFSDELIIAIIYKESGFRPGSQNGHSTVAGLMGMTEWARAELREKHSPYANSDLHDPAQNIDAATDYLKILLDRKHEAKRVFKTYGSGPQYLSEIRRAEQVLQGNFLSTRLIEVE